MIVALLITTFVVSFVVATIISLIFARPIDGILQRLVPPELSYAWSRYLRFAIYVVGISGGVQIWNLERYMPMPEVPRGAALELTADRWVLEIYSTIIGTLRSVSTMLLVFFVFALIAVVAVRIFETRAAGGERSSHRAADERDAKT